LKWRSMQVSWLEGMGETVFAALRSINSASIE
jgi:hypothetical protein